MWQPTQPSCSCSCFVVLTWAKAYLSVMAHWVAECTHTGLVWLIAWHFLHCFHQKCDVYALLPTLSLVLQMADPFVCVLHWFWNVGSCCLLDFECLLFEKNPFCRVYPGHDYGGPFTTIAHERKQGLLKPMAEKEWLHRYRVWDSIPPSKELETGKIVLLCMAPISWPWNAAAFGFVELSFGSCNVKLCFPAFTFFVIWTRQNANVRTT